MTPRLFMSIRPLFIAFALVSTACATNPATGQRTEARADLDIEVIEETFPHGSFVHSVRHANGVERPEPLAGRRKHGQTHGRQPFDEHQVIVPVAGPARLEPF